MINVAYKKIKRITHYENDVITAVTYKDSYGTDYTPIGQIVNCPDGDCNSCCDSPDLIIYDDNGNKVLSTSFYKYFAHINPYKVWVTSDYYRNKYVPVVLSNNSFFNSVVCKEQEEIYNESTKHELSLDEYSPVGSYPNMALRFSFKSGQVAIAYLKTQVDQDGYPLIPDDESCASAIFYYLKWKISERLKWQGRDGFDREAKDAERLWLKYVLQFKNKNKMPFGVDEYYNMMKNQYYIIPNFRKYLGYFGQYNR